MVITQKELGSITLTGSFQTIFEPLKLSPRWYEGWIYFDELSSSDNDVAEVKIWQLNEVTDTYMLYTRQIITGTQEDAARWIGGILTTRLKVEVAQTNGGTPVFKDITYCFYEVT